LDYAVCRYFVARWAKTKPVAAWPDGVPLLTSLGWAQGVLLVAGYSLCCHRVGVGFAQGQRLHCVGGRVVGGRAVGAVLAGLPVLGWG
jgi:hypothetical protein